MKRKSDLEKLVETTLVENLHSPLKTTIDRLLARGVDKTEILTFVRHVIRRDYGRTDREGFLTLAAVDAYLEGKS